MKTLANRFSHLLASALICLSGQAPFVSAQEDASPAGIPVEVFEALTLVQNAQSATYSVGDVQRIFRAVWWDVTYGPEEAALARQLAADDRPIAVVAANGQTLTFTKRPAPDAARQQRFLLPARFSPNDSSYFVEAFRNTKDAGIFIGASRVHENAAAIMETMLNEMINQARFQAKTGGDAVIIKLFNELEAGHRDANPAIQGEFADIVRRVLRRFAGDANALPAAVRQAAWLQSPSG